MGKSVSNYVVSTNVAGLGTTYDVTSEDDPMSDEINWMGVCEGMKYITN
jgi:hypothetical protein